jgi:hypothetical protein
MRGMCETSLQTNDMAFQIRISKHEIRNKFKYSKVQNICFGNLNFDCSDLFRVSDLEFRVFNLSDIVFFETVNCVNRSPE